MSSYCSIGMALLSTHSIFICFYARYKFNLQKRKGTLGKNVQKCKGTLGKNAQECKGTLHLHMTFCFIRKGGYSKKRDIHQGVRLRRRASDAERGELIRSHGGTNR